MAERNVIDFLSYNIYLTRWKETEVKYLAWDQNISNDRRTTQVACEPCCYGLFICLFALAGGSLPSSSRGGKRSNHRPQTEDSLWETQLGQRVHQYRIKAPGVSPLAVTLSLLHTRTSRQTHSSYNRQMFRPRLKKSTDVVLTRKTQLRKLSILKCLVWLLL